MNNKHYNSEKHGNEENNTTYGTDDYAIVSTETHTSMNGT
jgi:hypothetical protein